MFPQRLAVLEFVLLTVPVLLSLTCCSDPLHSLGISAVLVIVSLILFNDISGKIQKGFGGRQQTRHGDITKIAEVDDQDY